MNANRNIKDWLTILVALADDIAVALIILLIMWLAGISISLAIVIFLVVFFAAYALVMHRLVLPALRRRRVTGAEGMLGREGTVVKPPNGKTVVRVGNEYWNAESLDGRLDAGDKVTVVSVKGLMLRVRRKT